MSRVHKLLSPFANLLTATCISLSTFDPMVHLRGGETLSKMASKLYISLLFLLLSFTGGVVQAQNDGRDTSVCTNSVVTPKQGDPIKPQLPNYYRMTIECNILNRNFTVDYTEFYDSQGQRAALHITNDGLQTWEIFSNGTHELFTITKGATFSQCQVDKVTTASDSLLFGYKPSGDKSPIYTTTGALLFASTNGVPEMWVNQTTIRGTLTNLWRSCQYSPQMNATMWVDWYWTAPYPTWTAPTAPLADQVPVRAHVYGKRWQNNVARSFNHIYEFSSFSTNIKDDTVFETPQGVVCPNRQNTKSLPSPGMYFHFRAEILDMTNLQIGNIKEYYDLNMSLVRYDYTPMQDAGLGLDAQVQVHDFHTGVAYIMDPMLGNCTTTPIDGTGFDARFVDATHVRIRNTQEFFYFDKSKYTYEGTRTVRGILCDVWITVRTDWPPGSFGVNSTWEWYFATDMYTQNAAIYQFGMPIMMELDAGVNGHYIYNIYNYDEERPNFWDFDISACYNYTQKRDFTFLLPGDFKTVVLANEELFKYFVLVSIQGYAVVSPVRVSNLQVDYTDKNDILVSFTLLDKAPSIGNVVNPAQEISLDVAATQLTNAINNGQFVVRMDVDTMADTISMTAKPYTLTQTQHVTKHAYNVVQQIVSQPSTSGGRYSGGAMAGLAVAMLVVFFCVGVAVMYLVYRKRGGAFLPKKFDNADITKDDA